MIDLVNKIIFIHIPKTGGTSIENFFCTLRSIERTDIGSLGVFINDKSSNLERQNGHCTLAMYEDIYFGGEIPADYTLFTVVRDPISRFWSEYFWRRLPPPSRYPVSARVPLPLLMHFQKHPCPILKDLNSHLKPQYEFLIGKSTSRVHVLRFENLETEFGELMNKKNIEFLGLPRDNVTKVKKYPKQGTVEKYNDQVREAYSKDFESFGY